MKQLWAPWRLEFILGKKQSSETGCVLCDILKDPPRPESLLLTCSKNWAVVLNKFPYNNGHIMLVPCEHKPRFADLSPSAQSSFGKALSACEIALQECYHPDGMNFGYNLGKSAGAGIPEHIHAHVVPRWNGDTNFMPVLAETRCIPDHMLTIYKTLAPFMEKHFNENI